ncbi:double-CXXCG motif protein [Hyalangium gracile]|uniref:double-CXXCG motif protein n=1 Tax=Hyalangium gracile TaxID=394092 RepID=UPI001CCBAE6F|nr:double-CXXCG motif protein [Hyalangium gracile]
MILDKDSLPTHADVFCLANFATVLVGTQRFKEAVQCLRLEGLLFHELPLR